MSQKYYTEKMELFIVKNYQTVPNEEFTDLFNKKFGTSFSVDSIRKKSRKLNAHKKFSYTDDMYAFLKENSFGVTRKELVNKFNRCFGTSKTLTQILSVCHKRGYLNTVKTRYTQEMIEFLDDNAYGISRGELTKKFNDRFGTCLAMKTIRSMCNKCGIHRGFIKYDIGDECTILGEKYIKDQNNKMILKKKYVYEQNYERIKNDEEIIFVDGNHNNFHRENLIKVKRKERLILLGYGFLNKDTRTTLLGLSLVRLKIKADEIETKLKPKKQENQ